MTVFASETFIMMLSNFRLYVFLVFLIFTVSQDNIKGQHASISISFEGQEETSTGHNKMKIIGGEEVDPGRYPYQVGLLFSSGTLGCGGTLIHPQWVLTNSVCFDMPLVEIGRHNRSNINETYELHEVEFKLLHPNHNPSTREHNSMLLRLKTPSNYSTVRLDDGSISTKLTDGSNVTVMGWGGTEVWWINSDVLREVEINILNLETCKHSYPTEQITNDMICASRQSDGFCEVDRGGPLIIKGEDATSDVQVGLSSWKYGCDNPQFPSVFTLVSKEIEFINTMLECKIPNRTSFENCCSVNCIDGVYTCVRFPLDDDFDYSNCRSDPCSVGDGFCDADWTDSNVASCNYDGGDCCMKTCKGDKCCWLNSSCQDPEHRGVPDVIYAFFVDLTIVFFNFTSSVALLFLYYFQLMFLWLFPS